MMMRLLMTWKKRLMMMKKQGNGILFSVSPLVQHLLLHPPHCGLSC